MHYDRRAVVDLLPGQSDQRIGRVVRVNLDKLASRRLSVPDFRLQEERPQYVETTYYFSDQTKRRRYRLDISLT